MPSAVERVPCLPLVSGLPDRRLGVLRREFEFLMAVFRAAHRPESGSKMRLADLTSEL